MTTKRIEELYLISVTVVAALSRYFRLKFWKTLFSFIIVLPLKNASYNKRL